LVLSLIRVHPRSSASRSALTLIQKRNLELDADQI